MNLEFRPSTLGEILDRTASLYRSRFLVFFGIASVPAGVVLAFAGAFILVIAWTGATHAASFVVPAIIMSLLALIGIPAGLIATALAFAAISHAASVAVLGEKPAIIASYKAVWKRGGRYIGLLTLQMLILAVAPVVVWTMVVSILAVLAVVAKQSGMSDAAPSLLMLVLFLVLVTYCVWMLLRLCLAFPVSVVEGIGAWAALKRASSLSKGTRGRMLLLYLLGISLGWVVSILVTVPIMLAVALYPGMSSPQHEQTMGTVFLIVFYAASFAVQALTKPVYGIALILFYYDQRVRKEAFDIELLMQQAGMVLQAAPAPAAAPWMPAAAAGPAPWLPPAAPLPPIPSAQPPGENPPGHETAGEPA